MLAAFEHSDFSTEELLAQRHESVTVCVPARETADRIGNTIAQLLPLREAGLIDELLVIDADSGDGTAEIARQAGAVVHSENELMTDYGPCQGKGDAMWRALSVAKGEILVYLDGDIADIGSHYVVGLLGPLIRHPELAFVKGYYARPFNLGGTELATGGGRVTELTAKPLLRLTAPDLAQFHQPLAGEIAARRSLLESIPFLTGYGVEIAMLVDIWGRVGLDGMAQVDLGSKRNDHQSLSQLGGMASHVAEGLAAALKRHADLATGAIEAAPSHQAGLTTRPPLIEAGIPRRR
jgi:glucosyl-3-phosphoglycerate synthase